MYHRSREEKIREKAETDGPVLDLSNAYLGDDGCADVVRVLRHCPSKSVVDLRGNRIQADGMAVLAAMLKTNMTIVNLNLEWNCIGVLDHGMESLASALSLNTKLIHLDLRNNSIGPDGAILLANALKRNRTLEELDLRWNEIGSVGGNAFLDMLDENDTLLRLQLMGNNIPIACAESIEMYLKRNANRLAHSPAADTDEDDNNSDSCHGGSVHEEDPRILLEYLNEKEKLLSEIGDLKRQGHAKDNQIEGLEATIQQLQREVQVNADDRDRYQRREVQERQHAQDLTNLLEQQEAKRKREMEECSQQVKTLEQTVLAQKEEKFQLERAVQRLNDELEQLQKASAQENRLLDSENQKLRSQLSAVQDEAARLRDQVNDERRELDRREKNWQIEAEEAKQASARRAEMAMQALEQQLRHASSQADTAQAELQSQKQMNDMLQSQILQLKVAHESKLGEVTAKLEREFQERMERTVVAVEAQVDEMRRQRVQLEKDIEKHHMNVELIREEKNRQKKVYEEELAERDARIESLKENLSSKEEKLATVEMDLLRQMRKFEQTADRMRHLEQEIENGAKMQEKRIQELQELIQSEKVNSESQLTSAREKEKRLSERIASLEAMMDAAKQDHDNKLRHFAIEIQEQTQRLYNEMQAK